MTINSEGKKSNVSSGDYPPPVVHPLAEPRVSLKPEPFYDNYQSGVPIAIDIGSSNIRAGLTNTDTPFLNMPTIISRFRDRKLNRMLTYVGNDCFLDPLFKSSIKSPFDGPLINNWDVTEWLLDYSFYHLNVSSQDGVDNPIIINEFMATPASQRKNMYQLLFEGYNVPSVVFGLSDLFSFHYNNRNNTNKSSLILGCGNQSTNIIPVIDSKPLLHFAKRINWGGEQAVEYLSKSIGLKYPFFPTKITTHQFETMVQDFSYFSDDYLAELDDLMNLEYLHDKDVVLEASFNEVVQVQKSEEEIARQQEKRREQGKRLQEQAQKARLEKLVEKEADFKYYSELKERLLNPENKISKKQMIQTLSEAGFDDVADFNKYLSNLERSLKRARHQDIGENEVEEEPNFYLLDMKDEDLSEEQLKEKKSQKLQKANYEARKKAKEEKLIEKKRKEEEEAQEQSWREKDLDGWIEDKRAKLKVIVDRKKQREKLKAELNDRKSHAAQIRMKNIANLAADGSGNARNSSSTALNTMGNGGAGGNGGARSKRNVKKVTIDNDPNDTFGANDDDWMIYKDIANFEDEEQLEVENSELKALEDLLLKYDPSFNPEDLFNSEYNWKKSTLHKFLRGAYSFDPEDQHQQHQIHLNVERIKVPEILIQPTIAGLDQAGIVEISENLLLKRLPSSNFYNFNDNNVTPDIIKNIFLTGGVSKTANFKNRIVREFTSFLPSGNNLQVNVAEEPIIDAWRGMKLWSLSDSYKNSFITRKEYDEMGPEYIKEHNLGNVRL
ncbi:Arp5 protein [Saccharomycopsis crataegensis]|uniref:Arp5 protein n=1 Tax=Saccharomycopsis crataegensis TaxID=43959 RepID=A0AAV5QKY1_9ASCO|nr:Arp5 protein [Saccharomycopsis crataegensis]